MNEDFGNIEADLEALMAALELAGVMADQARSRAVALAQRMRKDAPRSRAEWEQRAQLVDAQGRDLGWMDTSGTRRIDLNDQTGSKDRNLGPASAAAREGSGQDSALMEADGQFFTVQPGQRAGDPDRVRPISLEDAQAQLAERRPDLDVRRLDDGEPRLEVTRSESESLSRGGRVGETERERPAASAVWDEPGPDRGLAHERPGRSAAEAFGATSSGSGKSAAAGDNGPSTAELTAVGATKTADTSMKR